MTYNSPANREGKSVGKELSFGERASHLII